MRTVDETARVYPVGQVPPKPTYPYTVIGYAPNAPVVRSMLGGGDVVGRFFVQHFATSIDALEGEAAITFATFDGKTYGGNVITQEVATPISRDPDDRGVLSITHTYRH